MKRFNDTTLLEVLNTPDSLPATGPAKLNEALDDFIVIIHAFCREERNIAERTRAISDLRSKLATYLEDKKYSSKRYSLLHEIIKRALSSIDAELSLIKMDLEHPERFIEFPSDPQPLARFNGKIIELIEYFLPLQIDGRLLLPSGEVMKYADLIRFLESAFGITIAAPQDRKSDVVNRNKPTVFIEKMLEVLRNTIKKLHQ